MKVLTVEEALALLKNRTEIKRIKPANCLYAGGTTPRAEAEAYIRSAEELLLADDPKEIKDHIGCRLICKGITDPYGWKEIWMDV